jgi:hypothetical protein
VSDRTLCEEGVSAQLVDARPSSGVSGSGIHLSTSGCFDVPSMSESGSADTIASHGKAGRHDEDQPGCASLVVWRARGVGRGPWCCVENVGLSWFMQPCSNGRRRGYDELCVWFLADTLALSTATTFESGSSFQALRRSLRPASGSWLPKPERRLSGKIWPHAAWRFHKHKGTLKVHGIPRAKFRQLCHLCFHRRHQLPCTLIARLELQHLFEIGLCVPPSTHPSAG